MCLVMGLPAKAALFNYVGSHIFRQHQIIPEVFPAVFLGITVLFFISPCVESQIGVSGRIKPAEQRDGSDCAYIPMALLKRAPLCVMILQYV